MKSRSHLCGLCETKGQILNYSVGNAVLATHCELPGISPATSPTNSCAIRKSSSTDYCESPQWPAELWPRESLDRSARAALQNTAIHRDYSTYINLQVARVYQGQSSWLLEPSVCRGRCKNYGAAIAGIDQSGDGDGVTSPQDGDGWRLAPTVGRLSGWRGPAHQWLSRLALAILMVELTGNTAQAPG